VGESFRKTPIPRIRIVFLSNGMWKRCSFLSEVILDIKGVLTPILFCKKVSEKICAKSAETPYICLLFTVFIGIYKQKNTEGKDHDEH